MGYSFERKKGITITQAFQKILDELNLKPNKIWVYKGSEFHNRSLKSWLEKNGIEMHSTHNQGKSVIAERFIRTLKIKIYKFMLSVSQNAYIDKLDDIEHKWTYQRTIKMKPVNLKSNTYTHILILGKALMIKIRNLKLVLMLKHQNIKMFLQKVTL